MSPWFYTKSVVIDERAIPFSHPVLTLHTRHAKDDELLLSTFIHEQLHWFFSGRPEQTEQAIADLRKAFPDAPTGGTGGPGPRPRHRGGPQDTAVAPCALTSGCSRRRAVEF